MNEDRPGKKKSLLDRIFSPISGKPVKIDSSRISGLKSQILSPDEELEEEQEFETTENDFKIFKEEAKWWIDYFGMKDWYFEFEWKTLPQKCRSMFRYDVEGKVASVLLNKDWRKDRVTEYRVRLAAYHEIVELMLGELRVMIEDREFNREKMTAAIHSVVRRLENTLFKIIHGDMDEIGEALDRVADIQEV